MSAGLSESGPRAAQSRALLDLVVWGFPTRVRSNFADAVNSLHGIHFDFGILSADNAQITIEVWSNLIANAANEAAGGADFRMRTAGSNDTFIAGYTGGNNSANAQAFIDGQNPDGTSFSVTQAASGTYNNGPAVLLPAPTLPPAS